MLVYLQLTGTISSVLAAEVKEKLANGLLTKLYNYLCKIASQIGFQDDLSRGFIPGSHCLPLTRWILSPTYSLLPPESLGSVMLRTVLPRDRPDLLAAPRVGLLQRLRRPERYREHPTPPSRAIARPGPSATSTSSGPGRAVSAVSICGS